MNNLITSPEQYKDIVNRESFSFIYYKNDSCSVCTSLLPKLEELTKECDTDLYVVDCAIYPEIAAQNFVLSLPALKVFFLGKEYISMQRFVDLTLLKQDFLRLQSIR